MCSQIIRILRSVLSASRLAVTLATQHTPSGPAGNDSRALQTSSASPKTETAFACTCSGSLPMSMSSTSMSWIIMSRTTPTSTLRKVIGLTRWISMKRGVNPSSAPMASVTGS